MSLGCNLIRRPGIRNERGTQVGAKRRIPSQRSTAWRTAELVGLDMRSRLHDVCGFHEASYEFGMKAVRNPLFGRQGFDRSSEPLVGTRSRSRETSAPIRTLTSSATYRRTRATMGIRRANRG